MLASGTVNVLVGVNGMGIRSRRFHQRSRKQPLVGGPSRAGERRVVNGGHAMHTRPCQLGRPLYVALLPVMASAWPALDDPLPTAARHNSAPQSCP
jgi:hypothetical protein